MQELNAQSLQQSSYHFPKHGPRKSGALRPSQGHGMRLPEGSQQRRQSGRAMVVRTENLIRLIMGGNRLTLASNDCAGLLHLVKLGRPVQVEEPA